MTTDPDTAQPEVVPSSTPSGPQVIPAPGTPEGEPGPTPEPAGFEDRASNPNSGGPEGLAGDMGVSSERTGPEGIDPRGTDLGLDGTGSKGSAIRRTDGGVDTSPTTPPVLDVSQGLDPDRDPALDSTDGHGMSYEGVDRTVGEPKPQPIDDPHQR